MDKKAESLLQPLPSIGFVRLPQVLAVFPVSPAKWWEGISNGEYPRPVKLSQRITAWRVEDIRQLIETISDDQSL